MNYPFKTICCIISSPCHLCNLEYDKVELRTQIFTEGGYIAGNPFDAISVTSKPPAEDASGFMFILVVCVVSCLPINTVNRL